MSIKTVIPRARAARDVDDIITYYLKEATARAAVARFPHLVFYVERDEHVDVWRVLHGQRDIPASMRA